MTRISVVQNVYAFVLALRNFKKLNGLKLCKFSYTFQMTW